MSPAGRGREPAVTCEVFDGYADELALGLLDEPLRSDLLAHAMGCSSCRSLLDGLAAVGDGLLVAAPELEPPAGFESRVLERLPAAGAGRSPAAVFALPAGTSRAGLRRWLVGVAAAIAVAVGAVAATLVAVGPSEREAASGDIVIASGQEVGQIRLLRVPVPHILITIPSPQGTPGVRFCELRQPDGTWVRVGSWEAADLASGVWAAGIDPSLLDATAMQVVTDQGVVLATAALG